MNRRAFLTWVGAGWVATSLPVAIAACSAQTAQTSEPSSSGGYESIGTLAELNKTGELLHKEGSNSTVLVVRDTSTNNLLAVNPTCTHAGCIVAWQATAQKFVCPCHGSAFGSDGKVLKGPAKKPLKTYQAKIENNSVMVKES